MLVIASIIQSIYHTANIFMTETANIFVITNDFVRHCNIFITQSEYMTLCLEWPSCVAVIRLATYTKPDPVYSNLS